MRILVACDSFKDALSAAGVCDAVVSGLRRAHPRWTARAFPLADGGEGTMDVLTTHLGLRTVEADVADALGRPIRAAYGLSADGALAVIEMARAAGLEGLSPAERDPMNTTTLGVGQMLADAARRGASRVILAIGGSATNDAGVGAAQAMGWRFLDAAAMPVEPVGGRLIDIARIEAPGAPAPLTVEVLCDVENPLFGPQGAAWTYGRQKGASDADLAALDRGLASLSAQVGRPDLAEVPGAGAAGGLGFGAMAFLGATLTRGAELIMQRTGFDTALAGAELVITGEGRLDGQTLNGKLIAAVCARAAAAKVPVIALCGQLSATPEQIEAIGLKAAYQINAGGLPLTESLARTAADLERTAFGLVL